MLSLRLLRLGRVRLAAVIVECVLLFSISARAFRSTQWDWLFRSEQKENLDIKEASLWLKKTSPALRELLVSPQYRPITHKEL